MFRNLILSLFAALALNAFAAVDVNRANQAELETIKGIGPGLSTKILAARKTSEFKNWADMVERVGGVGRGNAARFSQAGLTVAGNTFDASSVPAAAPKGSAPKRAKADKAEKPEKNEKGEMPAKARQ